MNTLPELPNVKQINGLTIVVPIICINGTSADDLLEQRMNAANAIRDAIKCLGEMRPHPRDYQLSKDDEPYYAAVRQHDQRERLLNMVLKEIGAEIDYIFPFVK